MRWFRKKPDPPAIPTYPLPVIETRVQPDPGIVVEEIDTSDMTKTGVHRAWDLLTGRFKDGGK